jgi:prevent-host-death family protein
VKQLNIHDAKTQFSSLVAEVEGKGERIVICRHGVPVADLVAHQASRVTKKSAKLGGIKFHYDPTEPLSEGEWPIENR